MLTQDKHPYTCDGSFVTDQLAWTICQKKNSLSDNPVDTTSYVFPAFWLAEICVTRVLMHRCVTVSTNFKNIENLVVDV